MKKIYLLLSSIFLTTVASAQLQFTSQNTPQIGDSIKMYTLDSTASNFSNIVGEGVVWDYSNLSDYTDTASRIVSVKAASATNYASKYGSISNSAIIVEDGPITFFNGDASKRSSQGVVYYDPNHGDLLADGYIKIVLDQDEGLYCSYPFAYGDSIIDNVEGTAYVTLNINNIPVPSQLNVTGTTYSTIDGTGELKLPAGVSYSNVIRYHIQDTIVILVNVPVIGNKTYLAIHDQYEYYDYSVSRLPIFTHTYIWFGEEGKNPRNEYTLVLSKDAAFTAGVNKEGALLTANVYPNPANNQVNIILPKSITNANIAIVDALGRNVISTTTSSNIKTINVSNLNKGLYFVKITNGNNAITKRLVIK